MNAIPLAEAAPVGEHLADELEAREMTQAEFAAILGRPAQFVSELIVGKKELMRESAAQIGAALGTSAEFWLNLQDSYLLWRQSQNQDAQRALDAVRVRAQMHQLAPVSLLVQRGFITDTADVHQQQTEVLALFGMKSFDDSPTFRFAARRSNVTERASGLQETWAACVRATAHSLSVAQFDEPGLRQLARQLSSLARTPSAVAEFQQLFANVGVKLVYVESFPGGKLDGCAMMVDQTPVIGISGRGKRLDKILFTLLHEVAHVLLGHLSDGGAVILDDLTDTNGAIEHEADQLAGDLAIASPVPVPPVRISAAWIQETAQELEIHPIVLVGRLQQDGVVPWRTTLVRGAPTVIRDLQAWASDAG